MHISEGVLDIRYCVAGYVATAGLVGWSLRQLKQQDIPKVSVMGAAFFVSSLIHFKIGVTSIHLTLIGLMGLFLGPQSILAILTGLFFQAVMFQHGGLSVLGLNTVAMGVPALLVFYLFRLLVRFRSLKKIGLGVMGASLCGLAVFLAAELVAGLIFLTDTKLSGMAWGFQLAYLVLALGEGIVSFFIVLHVLHVKPELLIDKPVAGFSAQSG